MMNPTSSAEALVVMGVSGSGKSAAGRRLAERLGYAFLDADAYHPQANIAKMSAGIPLTDADRLPWLQILRDLLAEHLAGGTSVVLACSALKAWYRDLLREAGSPVRFLFLRGPFDLIQQRMEARTDHFFDADLLQSQFDVLEPPRAALVIDIDQPLDAVVDEMVAQLRLLRP